MTALATDININKIYAGDRQNLRRDLVTGLLVIYRGALMVANATGNVLIGTDAASTTFAGVAKDPLSILAADNTTAGDFEVDLYPAGSGIEIELTCASVVKADIGKAVYLVDSGTVGLYAVPTNKIPVGRIMDIAATNKCMVKMIDFNVATA